MLAPLESFAPGGISNRRLHLLELVYPEDLEEMELAFEGHCSVILGWDAPIADLESIARVVEALLDERAVSISCWGNHCERVHEILNDTIVGTGESSPYSSSTMTTWHARESFEEALWYALFVAQPTDQFESTCRDSLVLLIDQSENADRARLVLEDPSRFSAEMLSKGREG